MSDYRAALAAWEQAQAKAKAAALSAEAAFDAYAAASAKAVWEADIDAAKVRDAAWQVYEAAWPQVRLTQLGVVAAYDHLCKFPSDEPMQDVLDLLFG